MPSGFHLHTSDCIEQLAVQYVACREKTPEDFHSNDLFSVEEVIVPSWGMGKWLERCLADQGIMLANMKLISLFAFFRRLLSGQSDNAQASQFDRETLVWRIFGILQEHPDDFAEFKGYIENGNENESKELRRFCLSRKLAEQFDVYMTERPELLARPCAGETMPDGNFWQLPPNGEPKPHWECQAKLWQALCKNAAGEEMKSPADMIKALLACDVSDLPKNLRPITIWGCSSMPLRQLALLKKLSLVTPVHFFCLNPCDSFWADELRNDWSDGKMIQNEPEELGALFDHTPLRQWASHEREFFKYVVEISHIPAFTDFAGAKARDWQTKTTMQPLKKHVSEGTNAIPQQTGILQCLQARLRGRQQSPSAADMANDDTLTIHICHNALREVEILHDHLLHLIETCHYTNSDIIVAAPDISVFLPFIDAVFQQPVKDANGREFRLAYSICGRSLGQLNPLGNALIALLDIGRNRYELPYVEKLLNYTEIRSRFEIEEEDIRLLVQWCQESGIRWGKDGKHEEKYGFPDFENFSWRHGFDRMLLGLAIDDDDSVNGVWEKAAPYSICDYPDGHIKLQRLLTLLDALQQAEEKLAVPCTFEEWKERLNWLMDTFFRRDLERKTYYRGLWNAIHDLLNGLRQSGYTEMEIPLEVIREAIVGKIDIADEESTFLGGAITFCNLRDARGIPCKVLCMLGMDNGKYPRRASAESLNLVSEQLATEKRTVSQQDRYFFLESLLAAQDYLLIYYRGLDDKSEQKYYPSTLVSELKSYVKKLVDDENFSLEIKQSLLPYAHRYFNVEDNGSFTLRDLWSYKKEFRAIDAMYVEDGDAVLDAFDNFGGGQQVVPEGGDNAQPQAVELPEILIKQRDSFRNSALLNVNDLEDCRHSPIIVTVKELEDFMENGGFTLLRKGLKMRRQKKMDALLENSEPLELDYLQQWQVRMKLNRWLNELLPPGETIPNKDVLMQCFERLKAENMIPITGNHSEMMESWLGESWIFDSGLCLDWRRQMNRDNKRILTVSFDNEIPQIPDRAFADLPHCFDNLDAIPGNPYTHVELQYETMKPRGIRHIYCTVSSDDSKYRLRGWVRHLMHNAADFDGDNVETVIVWKNGNTTIYLPMAREEARKYLKALLALFLYGQRNAVPLLNKCSLAASKEKPDPDKPRRWPTKYTGQFGCDIDLDYAMMLWARNKPEFISQEELLICIETLARNIIHIKEA